MMRVNLAWISSIISLAVIHLFQFFTNTQGYSHNEEGKLVYRTADGRAHRWISPLRVPSHPIEDKPNYCSSDLSIQEVFMSKDGKLYFIIHYRDQQWISPTGNLSEGDDFCCEWPVPLQRMFSKQTELVTGVVYFDPSSSYYLFTDESVSRYNAEGEFQQEYLHNHGRLKTAFALPEGIIYVVDYTSAAYSFDPWTMRFGEATDLEDTLSGIVSVHSIVSVSEDYPYLDDVKYHFFFTDRQYWMIDMHNKVSMGPPKDIREQLLKCRT